MKATLGFFVAMSVLAGHAAAQQTYRCTDPAGKTFFTDKPAANCRAVKRSAGEVSGSLQPSFGRQLPGMEPAGARLSTRTTGSGFSPERERELLASRCKTYREELEWLNSPAGKGVENHSARVGQINLAMRECR